MAKTNTGSRVKYTIDKTGFFAECAMMLLVQAAIFMVIGRWGMWNDRIEAILLIALPVVSCLLLALCVLLFGKKGFFLSSLPVLMGVVFFICRLVLNETNWVYIVIYIVLYLAVVIIYPATVFGWIRTKWLLPPLFGLPLLYSIIVRDLPRLVDTANPVSFSAGMQEMSILCMLAGLLFIGLGLKKHEQEPEVVEPEVVEPAPTPAEEPAPAPAPEPAPDPVPAPAPAPEPEPVPAPAPAPAEESVPAPQAESAPDFDPESFFEPAPEGSIPDLTLDPDPIDFGPEVDAHEQ